MKIILEFDASEKEVAARLVDLIGKTCYNCSERSEKKEEAPKRQSRGYIPSGPCSLCGK